MNEPPEKSGLSGYKIGYKKPPRDTRFKPGRSGNPRGRPKGAKSRVPKSLKKMRDLVIKEAYREVAIQDKHGQVSMPVVQAALRSLGLKAAQGNVPAHRLMIEITSRAEADELKDRMEVFDRFAGYKIKKSAELKAYKSRGEKPPQMLPHPDDIEIDYETGEVTFHGPVSEDDLAIWNRAHGTVEHLSHEISQLKEELEHLPEGDESIAWINEEIEGHQFVILTAALSILRRWKLPVWKMFHAKVPMDELTWHLDHDTDPKPPKRFEKIVKAKRG